MSGTTSSRNANTEIGKPKAFNRLGMAGTIRLNNTRPGVSWYHKCRQNPNWINPHNGTRGAYRGIALEQDRQADLYRAFTGGILRMFGNKHFKNLNTPASIDKTIALKIVSFYPHFSEKVQNRLHDKTKPRHGAVLSALHNSLRLQYEQNRRDPDRVLYQDVGALLKNLKVTVVVVLPELFAGETDEDLVSKSVYDTSKN